MPHMSTIRSQQAEMNRVWGGFANLGNEAEYCYLTQIITLNQVEEIHAASLKTDAPAGRRKILLPSAHEFTHWLDHTSTTWGRSHLLSIYNAFHARIANRETGFHHIVSAFKLVHATRNYHYYRVIGRNAEVLKDNRPWSWDTSCGVRFGADGHPCERDPLLFIRFFVTPLSDSSLIARVPLSPLTLTEASAVATEQEWVRREASREQGSAVDENQWHQAAFGKLYDPEYVDYNAAVHCLANHSDIYDIESVYPYASALATLCLNLPHRYFAKIRIPKSGPITWPEQRVEQLRATAHPAFAFLAMCGQQTPTNGRPPREWVRLLLKAAGLPELEAIEEVWLQEIRREPELVSGPHADRLRALWAVGAAWAEARGILGDPRPLLDVLDRQRAMPLPELLLGDDTALQLGTPIQEGSGCLDVLSWHREASLCEHQLREFLAGCGRVTHFP